MEITYNGEEPLLIHIGDAAVYIHERPPTSKEIVRARERFRKYGATDDEIDVEIRSLQEQTFTEIIVTDGAIETARILVP